MNVKIQFKVVLSLPVLITYINNPTWLVLVTSNQYPPPLTVPARLVIQLNIPHRVRVFTGKWIWIWKVTRLEPDLVPLQHWTGSTTIRCQRVLSAQ